MARDTSDSLTYYLSISRDHLDYLGGIRHWGNLKIGFEDNLVWLKDFTSLQMDAVEIKTIPYKQLYYSVGGKLHLFGSLLPERNIPSVLWSAVERGLPVTLPPFNHNYFGIHEKIDIQIVRSGEEKEPFALKTTIEALKQFIETAPAVRLKNLSWILIDDKVMIFGMPLLPVQGEVYWRNKNFILPAGYDLELSFLLPVLDSMLNADDDQWMLWNRSGAYVTISKNACMPLSLSSFRLTTSH